MALLAVEAAFFDMLHRMASESSHRPQCSLVLAILAALLMRSDLDLQSSVLATYAAKLLACDSMACHEAKKIIRDERSYYT